MFTDFDASLFRQGKHHRLYEKLGAHPAAMENEVGVHFALWAPYAAEVSVVGDFNRWDRSRHPLTREAGSGIWSTFIPGVNSGDAYRFHLASGPHGRRLDRPDPFAFRQSGAPEYLSYVWDLHYHWQDSAWMDRRAELSGPTQPLSIYQVHLASWRRVPEEGNRWLTFAEAAPRLAAHAQQLGFTHVELLPIMQQPLRGADYHRIQGFFAPAAHYGKPQELMCLIDVLHQHGIGVVLAWVPGYFPADEFGLEFFDGTHLFERHSRAVDIPTDGSVYNFDFAKPEVRSLLCSNALFWFDKYHVDGLRAMALDSVLQLDYARRPGEWAPNRLGGRENPDGLEFLREVTSGVIRAYPEALLIAEETGDWPLVCHAPENGGLGFTYKWDSTLEPALTTYFAQDPLFRKFQHSLLVERSRNPAHEKLVLPLSERTQGINRPSVLSQMPGDAWQRFANYRLLLGYLYLQPGKKSLFMGTEIAQESPWNPHTSLDWHLSEAPAHDGVQRWVGDLNRVYRSELALHLGDHHPDGFQWVESEDAEYSVFAWLRRDPLRREVLLCVLNCTPVLRRNYKLGIPRPGTWREILNSDARLYGGSGQGNLGQVRTAPFPWRQFPYLLTVTLPPLALVLFKHEP